MASEEMTFGLVLKKLMKESDLTQVELAKKISKYNYDEHTYGEVTRETVSRWIRDKNKPQRKKYVLDIIKALELKQRGREGVKIGNALLQKAGHEELTEEELKKYFGIQTNNNFTEFLNIYKLHLKKMIRALMPFLSEEERLEIIVLFNDTENGGQINMEKIEERLRSEGLTITHQGKGEK